MSTKNKIYNLDVSIVKNVIYSNSIETKDQEKIFDKTRQIIFSMIKKHHGNESDDQELKKLIDNCLNEKQEQKKNNLGFKKLF